MNLRSVDLNLLTALEALLEEAHVSRAAQRLNLSQPATSNALARARHLFGDPLLVRAPGGLRRTPRAEQLRGRLREALNQMRAVVDAKPPALAEIRQTVRLVISDFPAAFVAAPLLSRLHGEAPGIDLVFQPWHASDEIDRLRRGEIDIALTVELPLDEHLIAEPFGLVSYQIVMRRDHPATEDFDLDRWLEFPHILVSGRGERHGPVDAALGRMARARRVGAVVPTFLLALQFIQGSDLIGALPTRMIPPEVSRQFAFLEPPIPLEPFPLYLIRHRRSDDDAAVRFVALALADQISPASGLDGSA